MNSYEWYETLKKPSFAPPPRAFGIAWSILYPVIFVSFGYVFYLAATGRVSWIVATPFVLNLVTTLRRPAGPPAENPWQAATLEWAAPTPPPAGNFPVPPTVFHGPYDYSLPGRVRDFQPQNEA